MLLARGGFAVLRIKHTCIPIELSARSEVRWSSEETLRATGGSSPEFFFCRGTGRGSNCRWHTSYSSCVSIKKCDLLPLNADMRGITKKGLTWPALLIALCFVDGYTRCIANNRYFTRRKHYTSHTLAHTLPSWIKFSPITSCRTDGRVHIRHTSEYLIRKLARRQLHRIFVLSASYLVVARLWSRPGSGGSRLHWFSVTLVCGVKHVAW